MKKYIIFRQNGRLANALFRYFACALFAIKYNGTYILEEDCSEEEYQLYSGVDHVGDDLYHIITPNILFLQNQCIIDSNVAGFNTLGYVKKKINIDMLQSNTYIHSKNNHGIYVKKIHAITDDTFLSFYENNDSFNLHIRMNGYFQFDDIYLIHRKEILDYIQAHKHEHYVKTCTYNMILSDNHKRFLIKDIIDDENLDSVYKYDIVIHIRLGDFVGRDDFIEYIYMEILWESISFENQKVAIVIETPKNPHDIQYLEKCKHWFHQKKINVHIESNDVLTDFHIMKNARILICSMSTLSWCAAFLSICIETCYMPDYSFEHTDRKTFFKHPIENTIFYNVNKKFQVI